MYRATKQWQPNRYIQQLVRDGILYFFVKTYRNALYQVYVVSGLGAVATMNAQLVLSTFPFIIFYVLVPRFIISIRELYHRDIHGRRSHVDTGFGVQSRSSAGPDATVSAMVFVDGNQGPEVEGGTNSLGDLETGRSVHGSGLDEVTSPGGLD
ncbi:hypothetical protein L210DRAFT_3565041 [Boletus edulis BED1]|uniref:Uncharacterized protein n=1 Tax=Boletus edulis BED1 TaxID=1328754 RepID=A0AAD4BGP4_BOLED|nr:hypothetical protein L210DRAFT_3565041 [Boletus edulis BED1]